MKHTFLFPSGKVKLRKSQIRTLHGSIAEINRKLELLPLDEEQRLIKQLSPLHGSNETQMLPIQNLPNHALISKLFMELSHGVLDGRYGEQWHKIWDSELMDLALRIVDILENA